MGGRQNTRSNKRRCSCCDGGASFCARSKSVTKGRDGHGLTPVLLRWVQQESGIYEHEGEWLCCRLYCSELLGRFNGVRCWLWGCAIVMRLGVVAMNKNKKK